MSETEGLPRASVDAIRRAGMAVLGAEGAVNALRPGSKRKNAAMRQLQQKSPEMVAKRRPVDEQSRARVAELLSDAHPTQRSRGTSRQGQKYYEAVVGQRKGNRVPWTPQEDAVLRAVLSEVVSAHNLTSEQRKVLLGQKKGEVVIRRFGYLVARQCEGRSPDDCIRRLRLIEHPDHGKQRTKDLVAYYHTLPKETQDILRDGQIGPHEAARRVGMRKSSVQKLRKRLLLPSSADRSGQQFTPEEDTRLLAAVIGLGYVDSAGECLPDSMFRKWSAVSMYVGRQATACQLRFSKSLLPRLRTHVRFGTATSGFVVSLQQVLNLLSDYPTVGKVSWRRVGSQVGVAAAGLRRFFMSSLVSAGLFGQLEHLTISEIGFIFQAKPKLLRNELYIPRGAAHTMTDSLGRTVVDRLGDEKKRFLSWAVKTFGENVVTTQELPQKRVRGEE